MNYNSRVNVHSPVGRRIYTAHAALAAAMVARGEADYESAKVIILTQTTHLTDEMTRPRIVKWRVPHADSSAGDAGRGCASVSRHQTIHYQADEEQTSAVSHDMRHCGWRRTVGTP